MKKIPLKDEETGLYNAVVETPKHSRNKYAWDKKSGLFKMKQLLPEGMSFPFDFGFIPRTLAEDGDPLDILLLMDEPAYPGCYVPVRLIGVLEAEQKEDGEKTRNDRLIGVSFETVMYQEYTDVTQLNDTLVSQVESFFKNYNKLHGKKFKLIGCRGPEKAEALLLKAHKRYKADK